MQVEIIVADSLPPQFHKVSTVIGRDINSYQEDFAHRDRIMDQNSENVQALQQRLTERENEIHRIKAEMEMKFSFASKEVEEAEKKQSNYFAERRQVEEKY